MGKNKRSPFDSKAKPMKQGKFLTSLKKVQSGEVRPKSEESKAFEYKKRTQNSEDRISNKRNLAVAEDIKSAREKVESDMSGLKKW